MDQLPINIKVEPELIVYDAEDTLEENNYCYALNQPFCPVGNEQFYDSSEIGLTTHQTSVHSIKEEVTEEFSFYINEETEVDKPFKCDLCCKTFSTKNVWTKHKRNAHSRTAKERTRRFRQNLKQNFPEKWHDLKQRERERMAVYREGLKAKRSQRSAEERQIAAERQQRFRAKQKSKTIKAEIAEEFKAGKTNLQLINETGDVPNTNSIKKEEINSSEKLDNLKQENLANRLERPKSEIPQITATKEAPEMTKITKPKRQKECRAYLEENFPEKLLHLQQRDRERTARYRKRLKEQTSSEMQPTESQAIVAAEELPNKMKKYRENVKLNFPEKWLLHKQRERERMAVYREKRRHLKREITAEERQVATERQRAYRARLKERTKTEISDGYES